MRRTTAPLTACALALLLAGAWCADEPAPLVPPAAAKTPDVLGGEWVQRLRRNDLAGGFGLLTAADQARLARQWQGLAGRPDGFADLQIDTVLRLAQNDAAVDQAFALAQPFLAQIDPPQLAKSVVDIAGFLGLAADRQQQGAASGGLDYAGLRDWLKDLAAWIPTAGLADPGKARLALGHLVTAIRASGLRSAAEARALPLAELLGRVGPALPALKQALAVYGVQTDALLDSFTFALADAGAGQASVAIGFTALGRPRAVTLKLVQQDGAWNLAPGNDNPLTSLSQLVMMTLLMQGMGAAPVPAPRPAAPADDGAL